MDILFLGIVTFLFLLAVFDLSVGVSNDAVNFLSSAVGSKAASFNRIMAVAAIGVFMGACMSNGMMDIARHGIFRPENLSFYDVIAIFMAVMVTDIILLDLFNSLGMPTSTTVSLVFELLGATFVVALFKLAVPGSELSMGDLLNTEKALTVIIGIFMSVAIAFVVGTVVQFITRLIFTFEYRSHLRWKTGLFGGVACTAIIYFMLIKGLKDLTFMTDELDNWVASHIFVIIAGSLVFFSLLMQLLHWLKVNVFKIVVLLGTFALAMAFAGNDLVNFIGVPLTSLAAYQDYAAAGGADAHSFMMESLRGSASTPIYFLVGAGMIMVVSLATSSKARQVTQTTVGLSSQSAGDEMFGSSRLGRRIVRVVINAFSWISLHTPVRLRRWISRRMDTTVTQPEQGAAFDLIRASVNLMLAGILIAWGTSMKLPLSTTFVTFMVAMGTSLADRAWGRESAVFRITGVISVIGGWFITAAVAFIGAGAVVCLMHLGGVPVMIAGGVLAVALLIRSNIRFRRKKKEQLSDSLFQTIMLTGNSEDVWPLLRGYINEKIKAFLAFEGDVFSRVLSGFVADDSKQLGRALKDLVAEKDILKGQRRKLTLCFRRVSPDIAMEKNTWFHLANNMAMSINYSLRRIDEACHEHVDNNFNPLPQEFHHFLNELQSKIPELFADACGVVEVSDPVAIDGLRRRCEAIKHTLSLNTSEAYSYLRSGLTENMSVIYVYLNLLQESQELVTSLRKLLRAVGKLNLAHSQYRSFTNTNASDDVMA